MDEALAEAILIVTLLAIGSLTAIYYNTIINNEVEAAKEYTATYLRDTIMRAIKESYRRAIVLEEYGYGGNGTITLIFNKPIHISLDEGVLKISYMGKIENITLEDLLKTINSNNIYLKLIDRENNNEVSFIHSTRIIFNTVIEDDGTEIRIIG